MLKEWCAEIAYWNAARHIRRAEFWTDIAEWLGTHFTWEAIRARRASKRDPFPDPDREILGR